ncbi:hypothetical protein WN944_013484 [Citrus x changshan-huyou]|uniref:YDG domain-containing protein n=1 Tax=Citrus x changshan-huyou TaxID=2935761 RepID=A0AAP0MAC8_9ROSI
MIGLHLQIQGGIDYVKHKGKILATSIVASGGYDDNLDNSDVLIYTGQGGNVMNGGKEPEDQKLERGNLALANSIHEQNPVRVISGDTKAFESRTCSDSGELNTVNAAVVRCILPFQCQMSNSVKGRCFNMCKYSDASKGCSVLVIACKITTLLKEEK